MTLSQQVLAASALFAAFLPQVYANSVQAQPPEKIYAAICSTCHGADGLGGVSWIDGVNAPKLVGMDRSRTVMIVRKGIAPSMPGFAADQVTDDELRAIADYFALSRNRLAPPEPPAGKPVLLNILDADPWYADDGSDSFPDTRRVVLSDSQYLKVVNTGKTWHTLTADDEGKDSGFIGYAQYPGTGYYYAEAGKDLAPGCVAYHCHLHPYMQTEVCTPGSSPAPMTRASKNPLPLPATPGVGEIWVDAQTQEDDEFDQVDGAMQVINPADWSVSYIGGVGNNPHSAWAGKDGVGRNIVVTTSWHDNILTIIDGDQKKILAQGSTGSATAHIQVSPVDQRTWIATHHGGSNSVEKIDIDKLELGQQPIAGTFDAPWGEMQSGPHGIWFCDEGHYFLVANSFSNSVSLYDTDTGTQRSWAPTGGKFSLNVSVMHGDKGGCRRGYVANAESNSISVFDIDVDSGKISKSPLAGPLADANGNLALTDTSASPARWSELPTQAVISPPDSTAHGRYMVISNKGSFNVMIAPVDAHGTPLAIYTFPAGLGAHGVSFGRKAACDSGNSDDICYYAYVAYSFQNYFGVYDLEKLEGDQLGDPGSATETLRLEGGLASLLAEDLGLNPSSLPDGEIGKVMDNMPITVVCPDCRSGVHVADVPLHLTTQGKFAYFKGKLWLDTTGLGGSVNEAKEVNLDVNTNVGGFGVLVRPGVTPW